MKITSTIHGIQGRGFDSNHYVLVDDQKHMTLIDTGHDENRGYVLDYIKDKIKADPKDIENIILTHVHVDHSGGLASLVEKYGSKVHVFEMEADAIENGDLTITLAGMFKGYFDKTHVDVRLQEKDIFSFAGHEFKILLTPGHTSGSICLHDEQQKILISGDTVFANGSFGRVDFPTGSRDALRKSLATLNELDIEYLLPGHMEWVTGGANPHLEKSARFVNMMF
jgi:glyoxylase-like metal-dependent hydrolase (beta-lactamase superfamily II)